MGGINSIFIHCIHTKLHPEHMVDGTVGTISLIWPSMDHGFDGISDLEHRKVEYSMAKNPSMKDSTLLVSINKPSMEECSFSRTPDNISVTRTRDHISHISASEDQALQASEPSHPALASRSSLALARARMKSIERI